MKTIKGNIIDLINRKEYQIFVHGCNCYHTMGAGIAKTLADTFPEVYKADLNTPFGNANNKLGTYSITTLKNGVIILNAYIQIGFDAYTVNVNYDAIKKVFKTIAENNYLNKTIAYPMLGAGLSGGDWNIIQPIIEKELKDIDHTLIEWDGT